MANDKWDELADVPVSSTDELVDAGEQVRDRLRRCGEYWPSNAPLSAVEQNKRLRGWVPRTIQNIGDLEPLPEKD